VVNRILPLTTHHLYSSISLLEIGLE
jgi:hypothetical protein